MTWALGEMAATNPDSGAFSVYTAKAYGPVAGATVGWLWWIQLMVVIAAEALGAVAAVTGRTKVILLCPPNNPADISISHVRLEAFLRSVRSDVLV